jgi:hypothetical protein
MHKPVFVEVDQELLHFYRARRRGVRLRAATARNTGTEISCRDQGSTPSRWWRLMFGPPRHRRLHHLQARRRRKEPPNAVKSQ